MNWKEINQRLDNLEESDLYSKTTAQYTKKAEKFKPATMLKLWKHLHEDQYTSMREIAKLYGFNTYGDTSHISKWFEARGWGNYPQRIDKTKEQTPKILSLWNGGMESAVQISNEVGLSQSTVLKVLKENGIEIGVKTTTNEDYEMFNVLLEKGYSLRKIARETGFSLTTVLKHTKSDRHRNGRPESLQEENYDKVLEMFNKGYSQMKMVEELGLSRGTINRIVKKIKQNEKN